METAILPGLVLTAEKKTVGPKLTSVIADG
jgi:hypothetical protein